ncbi:YcnI family protein [Actinocorallia longicatena]|uniref:YncI copper-binding domain-containing protein n=1 Tax=Actinocorallia longicatena TaxID=111803 RepID=A0ABP6QLQ5_9ACTN
MSTLVRRVAAVTAASAVAVAALAVPASAHVTVQPGTAEQGSWSKVSFRVPNERDDASTTKIVVDLPQDHAIAFVSVKPVAGWTVKAEKNTLATPIKSEDGEITKAVTRITWTGGKIEPGQFQEFDVSLGPLPTDVDHLTFKADQTYSSGEVVHWNEESAEGKEAEHPAPVLKLTPKAAAPAPAAVAEKESGLDDGTARLLGGLGLAAGLAGLVLGALAFRRKSA